MSRTRPKITIVGAGRVGSNTAMLCVQRELGDIVLWNRTASKAKGLALDISESTPIEGVDASIVGTGGWEETADSDVVVVTAGIPRKPGMDRSDLLEKNAGIVEKLCKNVKEHSPDCILIVITNPLDAMVYHARDVTGFPRERIIGMAGVLDTSRFRSFIADELDVSVEDVSAMVLGGHGDSMVPLTHNASVAGIPLTSMLSDEKLDEIVEHTRNAGSEIVELEKESSAFYAPAGALADMIESIVRDKRRVLPCAAYLDGEYGVEDLFIGVPVVLGSDGILKILEVPLSDEEEEEFRESVEDTREVVGELKDL